LGHVPGGFARGYKLHVLVDSLGRIERFAVTGLARGEATVMRQLLREYPLGGLRIRADANYDSNPLYEQIARNGGRLIAPRRKPGRGLGHQPQHPDRLRAIAELERSPEAAREHRRRRSSVERHLGHLSNLPEGLWALPGFVRHQPRVNRWIVSKIVL